MNLISHFEIEIADRDASGNAAAAKQENISEREGPREATNVKRKSRDLYK